MGGKVGSSGMRLNRNGRITIGDPRSVAFPYLIRGLTHIAELLETPPTPVTGELVGRTGGTLLLVTPVTALPHPVTEEGGVEAVGVGRRMEAAQGVAHGRKARTDAPRANSFAGVHFAPAQVPHS